MTGSLIYREWYLFIYDCLDTFENNMPWTNVFEWLSLKILMFSMQHEHLKKIDTCKVLEGNSSNQAIIAWI